jgi:hypothetical protein
MPAIGSGSIPSDQFGVGFATGKPSTSSADKVALAMIVSNTTPSNEAFYDTTNGIGGADYTTLLPTTHTHTADFMGVTTHATIALDHTTGTMTTTV